MKKSPVRPVILWSIGILFLAYFLRLSFISGRWPWGILLFVVVFFGWGLERLRGGNRAPPKPAGRVGSVFLGIVTAIVSGVGCLFVAVFVLMCLGTKCYDNYEYYGQYPALYLTPGLVGLFLPSMLAWVVRKVRKQKESKP
jgi:hypothetical protein